MTLRSIVVIATAVACPAATALAQPLGTFRWQLEPFCNVLAVNVTQQAGIYTLDGTDDRCLADTAASVVGIAFPNPNGSIGFGLNVVLPGGTPVHIEATIVFPSLNGTWRDSAGNSGTFILTPGPGTGGSPRPIPSSSGLPAGSVTAAHHAANSVSGEHVIDGSLTAADLAAGSVTSAHIAAAAVGAGQLAPNSVAGSNIINATITAADLSANSVTGPMVVNGSLTRVDIGDAPAAAFVGANQDLNLSDVDTIVRSITITASAAGFVIVSASGYFELQALGWDAARCSITTGTGLDFNALFVGSDQVTGVVDVPFAGTRGFAVAAGARTFNLVCDEVVGSTSVHDTQMTAIFVAG